jgi:glycine cleavage system H protein
MSYPDDLKYSDQHEWLRIEGDVATVGITDHAQGALGDIVYVELPEVDTEVAAGDSVCEVESVKAVSDIYAPVDGVIVEVNEELDGAEDVVNSDPHGAGWIFRIRLTDASQLDGLMDAAGYQSHLAASE